MKPITKIIIFVVIAFILVIIITAVTGKKAEAPSTTETSGTSASHETINPNASTPATTDRSKAYTLADVAKHKTATDCWTTVKGGVYDLTPFVNQHPGGVANITKLCGIDGTALFTAQHGGQAAPEQELASLKIGILTQ